MAKGTAITLDFGASPTAIVDAVRTKYAEQRASASGWHGQAVVNVKAGDGEDESAKTFVVKGIKNGFELFAKIGSIVDVVETTAGEFTIND